MSQIAIKTFATQCFFTDHLNHSGFPDLSGKVFFITFEFS